MVREGTIGEVVTTYAGSPHDIVKAICEEINVALRRAGISPTGVHIIAMMYLVAATTKEGMSDPSPQLGKMPSFKLLLMVLTKVMAGDEKFSEEESEFFKTEFTDMVKSLGGCEISMETTPVHHKHITYMSPPSKEVH